MDINTVCVVQVFRGFVILLIMAGVLEVGSLLPTSTPLQICQVLNLGLIPHRISIPIIPQNIRVASGLVSNQCQHHIVHNDCI